MKPKVQQYWYHSPVSLFAFVKNKFDNVYLMLHGI